MRRPAGFTAAPLADADMVAMLGPLLHICVPRP